MVNFFIIFQNGQIKYSDDGSVAICCQKPQGVDTFLYPFKPKLFDLLNFVTPAFLYKQIYLCWSYQSRVYTQDNLRLVYTFQQRYNRNLMKINEFGLILLENQYSDFAILTSKGKIIRKTIDISYRKITYLRQQNNSLQIYLQKDKFGLQIYNISKGIFEKSVTMKFSEYNQGILPICQYDNIQILDHSKESMINIFRDMKFYQQIPYAYKYYSLSDDGQYITFFSKLSYTIYFYNCFSLEFEETYETNLPIYHARRVNIRTLQIEYQSVLVIVKL